MRNFMLIIRNLALVLCLNVLLFGCGEKQSETSSKPKVISQKVSIEKQTGPKSADETGTATSTDTAKPGEPPEKVSASAEKSAPGMPSDPKQFPRQKKGATLETLTGESSLALISYVSEGKIDPFAPLFREEAKVEKKRKKGKGTSEDVKKVKASPKRIAQTPLEKLDVSQFKLVGIIRTGDGNKALVQDASGKGYVLDKGTFIGTKSGFVTQITKNKVIVEEEEDDEAIDTDGLVTIRQRELVLQKPVGEI